MEDDKPHIVGHTISQIKKICRGHGGDDYTEQMLCEVQEELEQGFDLVKRYPNMVTILGSARTPMKDSYYFGATSLASKLVKDLNFTIATGGGPGIMEAANKGARNAGGHSLGMTIKLPSEQKTNPYVTEEMGFKFFFTRKVIMTYSAKAFIYFPGGFGTLNEFFEILTLVQTKKIPPVPMILVGADFWRPLQKYIRGHLLAHGYIDDADPETLYTISDSEDDIVTMLRDFNV